MYIAMNRFKIKLGKEEQFENIWKNRDSHLDKVDGFIEFNLLRSKSNDTYTLFASHSVWKSSKHFENWTKSESFRFCLLYTSPSPRDGLLSRMPSSA